MQLIQIVFEVPSWFTPSICISVVDIVSRNSKLLKETFFSVSLERLTTHLESSKFTSWLCVLCQKKLQAQKRCSALLSEVLAANLWQRLAHWKKIPKSLTKTHLWCHQIPRSRLYANQKMRQSQNISGQHVQPVPMASTSDRRVFEHFTPCIWFHIGCKPKCAFGNAARCADHCARNVCLEWRWSLMHGSVFKTSRQTFFLWSILQCLLAGSKGTW